MTQRGPRGRGPDRLNPSRGSGDPGKDGTSEGFAPRRRLTDESTSVALGFSVAGSGQPSWLVSVQSLVSVLSPTRPRTGVGATLASGRRRGSTTDPRDPAPRGPFPPSLPVPPASGSGTSVGLPVLGAGACGADGAAGVWAGGQVLKSCGENAGPRDLPFGSAREASEEYPLTSVRRPLPIGGWLGLLGRSWGLEGDLRGEDRGGRDQGPKSGEGPGWDMGRGLRRRPG